MSIAIGNGAIGSAFVGDAGLGSIWVGEQKIWQKGGEEEWIALKGIRGSGQGETASWGDTGVSWSDVSYEAISVIMDSLPIENDYGNILGTENWVEGVRDHGKCVFISRPNTDGYYFYLDNNQYQLTHGGSQYDGGVYYINNTHLNKEITITNQRKSRELKCMAYVDGVLDRVLHTATVYEPNEMYYPSGVPSYKFFAEDDSITVDPRHPLTNGYITKIDFGYNSSNITYRFRPYIHRVNGINHIGFFDDINNNFIETGGTPIYA